MRLGALKVVLLGLAALPGKAVGQSEPSLLRPIYTSTATDQERRYLLYLPSGYSDLTNRAWPVIFFLHGGGERGDGLDDLDHVLAHGPIYEAWIQKRDLPFIIVAPQLPVFDQADQLRMRADRPPERLGKGVPPRPSLRPSEPMMRRRDVDPPSRSTADAGI
jgi:predicted dienelactone hydrolase